LISRIDTFFWEACVKGCSVISLFFTRTRHHFKRDQAIK